MGANSAEVSNSLESRFPAEVPVLGLAELLRLSKEIGAVDFAVGSPSWPDPPAELVRQAQFALTSGRHQYEACFATAPLRSAAAEAANLTDDQIAVTAGGLTSALQTLLDPGDEVVLTLVNTPHNPTGRISTVAELSVIGEVARQVGAVVISGEVYAEFADHADIPTSRSVLGVDDVITLKSLSKSHAQWRASTLT
jgi:aspartate/methionine/tyrosine aminotransferase